MVHKRDSIIHKNIIDKGVHIVSVAGIDVPSPEEAAPMIDKGERLHSLNYDFFYTIGASSKGKHPAEFICFNSGTTQYEKQYEMLIHRLVDEFQGKWGNEDYFYENYANQPHLFGTKDPKEAEEWGYFTQHKLIPLKGEKKKLCERVFSIRINDFTEPFVYPHTLIQIQDSDEQYKFPGEDGFDVVDNFFIPPLFDDSNTDVSTEEIEKWYPVRDSNS